jgi:hypothetical protein
MLNDAERFLLASPRLLGEDDGECGDVPCEAGIFERICGVGSFGSIWGPRDVVIGGRLALVGLRGSGGNVIVAPASTYGDSLKDSSWLDGGRVGARAS